MNDKEANDTDINQENPEPNVAKKNQKIKPSYYRKEYDPSVIYSNYPFENSAYINKPQTESVKIDSSNNDIVDDLNYWINGINRDYDESDKRSLYQRFRAMTFSHGNDINYLVKNRDRDNNQAKLIKILSNSLVYECGIWMNDKNLFIIDCRSIIVKYDEKAIAKEICNEFGLSERSYINSIMPDITERITRLCKRDRRIFTDKTIRDNWRYVNFTNCLYDVHMQQPVLQGIHIIKTSYLSAKYIDSNERGENDGGLQEFAALCSSDIIGQKRILQAITYALSDYRDNNRLFFFETNNIRPRQIIVKLLEKVLGKGQIAQISLNNLTKSHDLEGIKIIISISCSSKYEETDNDKLYNLIKDTDFVFEYEEGKKQISEKKRNDAVVFHFSSKLPQKYLESLESRIVNLITTIKLHSSENVDWDEMEAKIIDNSDYSVSYLAENILPELCENGFELDEDHEVENDNKTTENLAVLLKQFIKEMCVIGDGYKIRKEDLYQAFLSYSKLTTCNQFYRIIKKEPYINTESRLDIEGKPRAYGGIDLASRK